MNPINTGFVNRDSKNGTDEFAKVVSISEESWNKLYIGVLLHGLHCIHRGFASFSSGKETAGTRPPPSSLCWGSC